LNTTTIAGGLAAVALCLGVCGCGTSKTPTSTGAATPGTANVGGSSPTGPSLARVALAAKAGAICSAATAEGRTLKAPANLTSNARAAAAYFDKAVPPLDTETKALQALSPAAAVSAEWEAFLGAQVALDGLADGYREKAAAGQQTSIADVQQLATVGRTIASAAARLGARCT
jgi:hypothetical protein